MEGCGRVPCGKRLLEEDGGESYLPHVNRFSFVRSLYTVLITTIVSAREEGGVICVPGRGAALTRTRFFLLVCRYLAVRGKVAGRSVI